MSIPIVPGFIEGPAPSRLGDLWKRPEGDFPDDLWPEDVLASIVPEPTGWLTVCEHYSTDVGHGGRGCVLVARTDTAGALGGTNWLGRELGTFSIWEDFEGVTGFEAGLASKEQDVDLEFFVQVSRPAGSPDPVLDLSHPFLWYFDAYPVRTGWAYVNAAGRPQELVRTQIAREHWVIDVRALEFRQFLHACGRDALVQVDCVPISATADFTRVDDDFRCEWASFDFVATSEEAYSGGGGFSRLLGQYVVKGNPTSRRPRMHERRTELEHPDFIYGVDPSTGEPLRHTCDPAVLGTYFDKDNSRLHYLTPVYFKREVLIPYAQEPSRYRLSRSRLECLSLWGLDLSFNTAGLVEVYLGDLGRDLPAAEWGHWITYNVIPEGKMEEGRFRRDFLNQFASSPDIPSELRRARRRAAEVSDRVFGAPVWRHLDDTIGPEYESMIGPLTDDPAALQGPLILMAKCFVDAIDPGPLKVYLGDAEPGERSLSLLGRTFERLGGSKDDVEGLRALYDVRSAGGFAHLGGSGQRKAFDRLGITDLSTIDAFDHIAGRVLECLNVFSALLDE